MIESVIIFGIGYFCHSKKDKIKNWLADVIQSTISS